MSAAAAPAGGAATAPPTVLTAPMTFTLVRAAGPECDPFCPEWIAAQGEIQPGAAGLFQAFMVKLDGRRRPILINSPGGSVEDALAMGQLIRAGKLAVAVASTRLFEGSAASPNLAPKPGYDDSFRAQCNSACTLVLAAGVERYASPFAFVGVHQTKRKQTHTFILRHYLVRYRIINGRKQEISRTETSEDRNTVTSTEVDPAAVNARLAAYFVTMGEDAKLIALMETAAPDAIHRMTTAEEKDTRLVTISLHEPSAMGTRPNESGLAGAGGSINAGRSWLLEASESAGPREFAAEFTLRRGGAGVLATYSLLDASGLQIRFGVAPRSNDVRVLPSSDWRATSVFLPNEVFCRYARIGDLYVVRAAPEHPPTYAPGLPEASAPLLLTPFAGIPGIDALAEEACGEAKSAGFR